jgi:hypothetical protein
MGTTGSFPGGKAGGEWSWPLTSTECRGQEFVELYLHSPNTSSWRGAWLSTGTTLPLPVSFTQCSKEIKLTETAKLNKYPDIYCRDWSVRPHLPNSRRCPSCKLLIRQRGRMKQWHGSQFDTPALQQTHAVFSNTNCKTCRSPEYVFPYGFKPKFRMYFYFLQCLPISSFTALAMIYSLQRLKHWKTMQRSDSAGKTFSVLWFRYWLASEARKWRRYNVTHQLLRTLKKGSGKVFLHVGILPPQYTVSQPRTPRLASSPPWNLKSRISLYVVKKRRGQNQ